MQEPGQTPTRWQARPDRDANPYREASWRRHPLTMPSAGLASIAVLTPLHGLWAVQLFLVPLLLVVPGVIFLRAVRVTGEAVARNPVYVPASSIIVLLCSGLAADLIGPLVDIGSPLKVAPLLVALEAVCVILLAGSLNAPPETRIPWSLPSHPIRLVWPLLIPLLSAAGALRLNSSHSGLVADIALVVVMIAGIAGFLFAPWCDDRLLMIGTFAIGLAMMWSFSLRGDLVYGFDISSEYYSLEQTVTSGIWHLNHTNDAYGAMLSLTVLPAEFHALSGMSALFVFKVIYPVIGALFPVALLNLARHMLVGRWAFMAALLVLMQQTFFQQMPALARQEVATFLFATLMLIVLDTSQSRLTQWVFASLLSLSVVVSHYSTAYLAIALLGITIAIQWVWSWFREVPRITGVALLACVVSIAGTTVWYGALTHSSSNLSQFIQTAKGQGINLLPNQGANPLASYLLGETEQQMSPAQYQNYSSNKVKQQDNFITPLPDASDPQYALRPAPSQSPPVTSQSGTSLLNLADLLIQQILNVLVGISALILALQRKAPVIVRQVGLLGLAGMVILTLTRLSGTIAQAYNPQRAFLQMMIILAIGICWVSQRMGRRWKWTRSSILAVGALSYGLFFVGSSGISGVAFGGGTPANLANTGNDYQEFVKTTPELAAASWVNQTAPPGQFIYADRYAELLLHTVTGTRSGVFDAIAPETIDQHAWVYATHTNLYDNIVRAVSGNNAASYAFPRRFLTSNFNLVYTNGNSEVFHR